MTGRPAFSRNEIFFIAASTILAVILSALFMRWYQGRDDRWFRVAAPAGESATQILAVDRVLRAYVATREGNLFLCGDGWTDACRPLSSSELPVVRVPERWRTCGSEFPDLPAPPGPVVDSIQVGRCSEARTYGMIVLLDDGTIWQWRQTYSWVYSFAFGTCLIIGLLAGVAAGIVIVRMRRYLVEPAPAPLSREQRGPSRGAR